MIVLKIDTLFQMKHISIKLAAGMDVITMLVFLAQRNVMTYINGYKLDEVNVFDHI